MNNNQKIPKIITTTCIAFGLASLVIFIPAIRNLIINFLESLAGHTIARELWNTRLLKWECSLILLIFAAITFMRNPKIPRLNKILEKNYLPWIFCGIFSVCLIALAFISDDVWLDETFSLGLSHHSVSELVGLTARDVHPPMYYLILKAVLSVFPHSVTAAKIVSVIPTILVLVFGCIFLAKEYDSLSATLFALLIFAMPSMLFYSIEIRMYSWGCLFVLWCGICAYYMIKDGRLLWFVLFAASAVLGAYTQYWIAVAEAILFVLTGFLCLMKDSRSWKKLCLVAVLCVISYLPWLKTLFAQFSEVSSSYWIAPISLRSIADYVLSIMPFPFFIKLLSSVAFAFVFIKMLIGFFKERKVEEQGILLAFGTTPFLLIAVAIVLSLAIRPIFVSRYAVPTIPLLVLFLSIAWKEALKSRPILFIFALIFGLFGFASVAQDEYANRKVYSEFKKIMSENVSAGTVFVTKFAENSNIPYCITFLFPENRHCADFSELWTSTYNFDRKNLIQDYEEEKDLCFVFDTEDVSLPEGYEHYKRVKTTFSTVYPNLEFVFTEERNAITK